MTTIEKYKSLLGVWELAFVAFGGFFFELLINSVYFEGHNFFNYVPFLMNFSALGMLIGGVQFFFRHQNQWSPPFGFGVP